jgi:hypothetical protein
MGRPHPDRSGFQKPFDEMEHRANFPGRAAGDVKEHEQFRGGAAFEALGNVVRHGKGGAAELGTQIAGAAEGALLGQGINSNGRFDRRFPDWQIFKAIIFHACFPFP